MKMKIPKTILLCRHAEFTAIPDCIKRAEECQHYFPNEGNMCGLDGKKCKTTKYKLVKVIP